MALIHPQSCECIHSGLDLFSVPPTQTAVEEGQFVEVHPLAALAPNAPIEFAISGQTEEYLDLNNTFLHVTAKVTKANGNDLDAGNDIAPINLWLHSLFSQADVSLNDTVVSPSENTYAYRAYLETELSYNAEAKNGFLSAALYAKDTPEHMDATQGDDNTGLKERREAAAASAEIDMIGRLHSDMFTQDRYLLNGVDVKIKLTPSKEAFHLIGPAAGFKTVITHASLLVRKAKLNPAVALAHEKALEKGNAKYPMKRVLVKSFAIARGMMSHNQDNLFLSQTPTRLVIGLVESAAFNGAYAKNPFNFKHFGLTYLSLNLDGRSVMGKPLSLDFEHNKYSKAFFGSKVALGLANRNADNDISYKQFKNGYTLFSFDLSPSLLDGEQFEMIRSGALSLELKFAQVLTETVQVLVYAELDSVLEIDRSRQILTDFAV
jgi:hypothetical protein